MHPDFLGRDPLLLKRLSEATGLKIITNTRYGAAAPLNISLPTWKPPARNSWPKDGSGNSGTASAIPASGRGSSKAVWIRGPLSNLQKKIVRAAALTNKETGLPVWIHTGDGAAALEEAAILKSEGVFLGKYTWVHAQNEKIFPSMNSLQKRALSFLLDGLSKNSAEDYISRLIFLKEKGLLQQVLLSPMQAGITLASRAAAISGTTNFL